MKYKFLKKITNFLILSLTFFLQTHQLKANPEISAVQLVEKILESGDTQKVLIQQKEGIAILLDDPRLTNQETRQMLNNSRSIVTEMLEQRVGENAGKLVELAKWLKDQGSEQNNIYELGQTPTARQQIILDNPIAGLQTDLTSVIHDILNTYLNNERENTAPLKLEALLQLYINFSSVLELRHMIVDSFMLYSPQWAQSRFLQLSPEQKQLFLKDATLAKTERDNPPGPDQESLDPLTPAEQSSYNAIYQFIFINTPRL